MADLILDGLGVTLRGRTLLHPCTATIAPGRFIAVVGANGAGKSTLLRAIAGLVPTGGATRYDSRTITALHPVERARLIGYLPQTHDFAWPMPVRDMVALGLYAFGGTADSGAVTDRVDAALALCGITALADRAVDRLSGGERAMAALARVLIGDTPVLLLDEPAAALDVGRQYQVLDQLAACAAAGKTVIVILHDLRMVQQYADRILWIDGGTLVADTENSVTAIDTHAPRLLGRAPRWSGDGTGNAPTLYFSRSA
jgi:iron complex transport system ATP-binding protein